MSDVADMRRIARSHSSCCDKYNVAHTAFLFFVGLFLAIVMICSGENSIGKNITVLLADVIAPPYPELLEENRKGHNNRALTETRKDDFDGDEICRYLDDDQCEEIEVTFVQMAAKTRARIVGYKHNADGDNRMANLRTFSASSNNDQQQQQQQLFTLRTLVILVAWKDQEERREWMTRDQIDHLWNGFGADDAIPTGSIKNYTERQAYGTLNFVADILDWQVTDGTEEYYADKRSGMPKNGDREPHLRTAFHYILNKMDAENFPWGDYDSDNDGYIDHIQFLHSGYGAEVGGRGRCAP